MRVLGKSFVKGAAILTVAGILGKMMGALYRIPFNRIAGKEAITLRRVIFAREKTSRTRVLTYYRPFNGISQLFFARIAYKITRNGVLYAVRVCKRYNRTPVKHCHCEER